MKQEDSKKLEDTLDYGMLYVDSMPPSVNLNKNPFYHEGQKDSAKGFKRSRVPIPDWKKRVELETAYAMLRYSPNNLQEYST